MSDKFTISPDQFESTIKKMLDDYGDEVQDAMKEVLPQVAKDGVKKIKSLSPSGNRRSGKYKDTWTQTTQSSRLSVTSQIHQKAGKRFNNWRLVHLLVKGHMARNGEWVPPAKEHYEPTQDYVEKEFVKRLALRLERGN